MRGDKVAVIKDKMWVGHADKFFFGVKLRQILPVFGFCEYLSVGLEEILDERISVCTSNKIVFEIGVEGEMRFELPKVWLWISRFEMVEILGEAAERLIIESEAIVDGVLIDSMTSINKLIFWDGEIEKGIERLD